MVESFNGRFALLVAECKDFLQSNANVGQVFLNVRASIVFLAEMHLVMQIVGEFARTLPQPQFDLF